MTDSLQLVDKFQLAKIINVHPRTVSRWMEIGLPFYRISRIVIRYDVNQVREWIIQQTIKSMKAYEK